MKNKIIKISIIFLIIITLLISLLYFPYHRGELQDDIFYIPPGKSLSYITLALKKDDVIISSQLFKWIVFLIGKSKLIKTGEYVLPKKISIIQLINIINEGINRLVTVTIPEGYSMAEIFKKLEEIGINQKSDYEALVNDQKFIDSLGIPINITSLEGFLYPETYKFGYRVSVNVVITKMVKTFMQKIPPKYEKMSKEVGLTFYQALILASIIEKETGVGSERTLISSVFHNRLKKRIPLATDPSVIYGIKNFDGNLTKKHLRKKTPYNTYRKRGLPPTPITNPGLKSILAAVHPTTTNFLYFVAKGDGTHKFSVTLQEHNSAVRKYQKLRDWNKPYRSH